MLQKLHNARIKKEQRLSKQAEAAWRRNQAQIDRLARALQQLMKGVLEMTCVLILLSALAALFSGCGTIPDAHTLLRAQQSYLENSDFVGRRGPLTKEQGQRIIARLEEHQKTRSDILQRHLAFEQAISDIPLVVGNKVTLLENGAATYRVMLAAIRDARDNINIDMYTFSDGPVGQMFADALIERQRHGVQVNLIYDSLGSFATPASYFDHLRQNGIAVLQYRPVNPFEVKLHWTLSHRNHRKLLIVDGHIAFTGGTNISEVYASGPGSREGSRGGGTPLQYWRDTNVELNGPVVAEIQRLFISEWYFQKGSPLNPRNYFPKLQAQGDKIVRVIASVPEPFSSIYVDLISAIVNSETNVYITDAYFAPDHQMLHALEDAARRGVDVRLLLPSQSDEPMIVSAERSHYEALLKSGIKIYEWQGEMLHAKTATIDGLWSTVGSSNLDWWSIARNNEVNAIILSHSFGGKMNRMFRSDMENSTQIDLDQWKRRGLCERLDETAAWMIEPLL
jgi:cardiolipin synthase A/B